MSWKHYKFPEAIYFLVGFIAQAVTYSKPLLSFKNDCSTNTRIRFLPFCLVTVPHARRSLLQCPSPTDFRPFTRIVFFFYNIFKSHTAFCYFCLLFLRPSTTNRKKSHPTLPPPPSILELCVAIRPGIYPLSTSVDFAFFLILSFFWTLRPSSVNNIK